MSDNQFVDVNDAETLLLQYSEWLDPQYTKAPAPGDDRTHADLVRDFIQSRSEQARPLLEDRSMPEMGFGAGAFVGGPEIGTLQDGDVPAHICDHCRLDRQISLDFATRWASMEDTDSDPEAIVDTAESFLKFLQGGEE